MSLSKEIDEKCFNEESGEAWGYVVNEVDEAQVRWSNAVAQLEAERDDYKLMYEQRVKDAERDYRYFKAERDRLREDIVKAKSALLGEAGAGVAVKILSRALEESG